MAKKVNLSVKKDEKTKEDPKWRAKTKNKQTKKKLTKKEFQRKIPNLFREGDFDWLIDTAHPKNTTKYPNETKRLGINTDYALHYDNDETVLR